MSLLSTIAFLSSAFALAVNSMSVSMHFEIKDIKYVETKDIKYFVVNAPANFDSAVSYCERKEARLAVVDTEEKATTVYNVIKNDYEESESSSVYWIGARARPQSDCGADNFTWLGTETCLKDTFTNWCDGEPNKKNEECVHVENRNNTYCWATSNCHQKNIFVCERDQSDASPKRALERAIGDNVIFSPASFLPRSVSFNMTVDLYGHSFNFIELDVRASGLP